jgi:hypothetical protein
MALQMVRLAVRAVVVVVLQTQRAALLHLLVKVLLVETETSAELLVRVVPAVVVLALQVFHRVAALL